METFDVLFRKILMIEQTKYNVILSEKVFRVVFAYFPEILANENILTAPKGNILEFLRGISKSIINERSGKHELKGLNRIKTIFIDEYDENFRPEAFKVWNYGSDLDIIHVCLDTQTVGLINGRSGPSTPLGAATIDFPAINYSKGCPKTPIFWGERLNFPEEMFLAQVSLSEGEDFSQKVTSASESIGYAYFHLLFPNPFFWGVPATGLMDICALSVSSGAWPIFSFEGGRLKYKKKRTNFLELEQYLLKQSRFRHLEKPENANFKREVKEQLLFSHNLLEKVSG